MREQLQSSYTCQLAQIQHCGLSVSLQVSQEAVRRWHFVTSTGVDSAPQSTPEQYVRLLRRCSFNTGSHVSTVGSRNFRCSTASFKTLLENLLTEQLHKLFDRAEPVGSNHFITYTYCIRKALMLQENSNHVERTIEAIFRMEGGGDDVGSSGNNRR